MEIKNPFSKSDNITFKGLWIGFLVLILMLPISQVNSLVHERQGRQTETAKDVSQKWASNQTVTGPVLVVPYFEYAADLKTKYKRSAYFLPDQLNIETKVDPEIRHRGIFDVVVYNSLITMKGNFGNISFAGLEIDSSQIIENEIKLQMGLTDFRGISDQIKLSWNEQPKFFGAGVLGNDVISNGVQVTMTKSELKNKNNYIIELKLRGSEYLFFTPFGKVTRVHMTSTWPSPKFAGNFLPSETSTISDKGFEAQWNVLDLNRNYPQVFKDTKYAIQESSFGVDFKQLGDLYVKTDRSIKYAFLFIALTFGLYFIMEIFQKKKVHSSQYILLGLALCLFYLLLLSISEYLLFDKAYAIAALAIVSMVAWYTLSIFKNLKIAGLFTGVIALLYSFIFVLIQLQEKALLIGSISLFVILGIVMYVSRKIDLETKINE